MSLAGLAVVLLLAGCTVAGDESDPDTSASEEASAEASASPQPAEVASECLDGDWTADLNDLIGQLADQLRGSGMNVTAAEAAGAQTLVVGREGVLGFEAAMTFTLAVDMGGGMVMTMVQQHDGTLGANWAWADDATATGGTLTFSDFNDASYQTQTTVDINGQSAEMPVAPPSVAAANVPTVVACDGDTLTTQPQGSPFTTRWTRTG